jgi:hypothetical protein
MEKISKKQQLTFAQMQLTVVEQKLMALNLHGTLQLCQ